MIPDTCQYSASLLGQNFLYQVLMSKLITLLKGTSLTQNFLLNPLIDILPIGEHLMLI